MSARVPSLLGNLRRGDRRRGVVAAVALLAFVAAAAPALGAQAAPANHRDPWRGPRVLKWTLMAVSIGAGLYAYGESREADDAYADLRRFCRADEARCTLEGGSYVDPRAESLYRLSNDGDRRARFGLVAGQAALLGSVAFWIVDLGQGGPPENIPYDPDRGGRRSAARLRIGLSLPLARRGSAPR
jgi:hypothetical protein